MADAPSCLVLMGFNERSDPQSARVLDLEVTFGEIVRPAVEAAGFACRRADSEVTPAGFGAPPWQLLRDAPVAVADLSGGDARTLYALGVRHALRPRGTVVLAEAGWQSPFADAGPTLLRYRHEGRVIAPKEVARCRTELQAALKAAAAGSGNDSPVYAALPGLRPPGGGLLGGLLGGGNRPAPVIEGSWFAAMTEALVAKGREEFQIAAEALRRMRAAATATTDPYLVQQLALVTMRAGFPDAPTALREAARVLEPLAPRTSLDPQTLALWGTIHARIVELPGIDAAERSAALENAIAALQRAFTMRTEHGTGTPLAYLLDLRAAETSGPERIADRVMARRVRQALVPAAEAALELEQPGETEEDRRWSKFWIMSALAEAHLGLGESERSERWLTNSLATRPSGFMRRATFEQLAKLKRVLEEPAG